MQIHRYKDFGSVVISKSCDEQEIVHLYDSFKRRAGTIYSKFQSVDQLQKFACHFMGQSFGLTPEVRLSSTQSEILREILYIYGGSSGKISNN